MKNRLKYALNATEVKKIVLDKEGLIKVDNRVRRDVSFPCGIMDVLSIDKTGEFFRILYDVKGRFQAHKIDANEATYKLCKVVKKATGKNKVPYIVTHDGRTIRYQHPEIKINDTIKLSLETGEIEDWYKFEQGNSIAVIGGSSKGRIGTISHFEKNPGEFNVTHIIDPTGKKMATRYSNVMVIGHGKKPAITLYKDKGIKLSIVQEKKAKGNFMEH